MAAMLGEAGLSFLTELLTHGALPDAVDRNGSTPLHLAATQVWYKDLSRTGCAEECVCVFSQVYSCLF